MLKKCKKKIYYLIFNFSNTFEKILFRFQRFWPHSLILGTELPGYCVLLISTERIFAVTKPALYNRIFMGRYKVLLLASVPLAGLVS